MPPASRIYSDRTPCRILMLTFIATHVYFPPIPALLAAVRLGMVGGMNDEIRLTGGGRTTVTRRGGVIYREGAP